MELDLNKGRAKRGMENPLSAIFDLADDVSEHSRYVKKMVWYAIIFMIFWMFFNFLLVLQSLSQGNVIAFPLFLGLLISGLVAIILILRTHLFFKYFTHRYNGIKTVRESDQPVKIPKGDSIEERYLKFLTKSHPPMAKLLKRKPQSLNRTVQLTGGSGDRHKFDIYMTHPSGFLWNMFGFGEPGYGLFVKKYKGIPKMTDILSIKKAVKDVVEAKEIIPSRIVLLCKFPKDYNGLSEDLYTFLVREEFKIEMKRKSFYPVVQVVGETEDGFYDFTPLVPEFADRLP